MLGEERVNLNCQVVWKDKTMNYNTSLGNLKEHTSGHKP